MQMEIKYKWIEIISSIFADHNDVKWHQLHKEKQEKNDYMEITQHSTKNQCFNDETKEEMRKYLKTNDHENTTIWNLWHPAKAVWRGKFVAT